MSTRFDEAAFRADLKASVPEPASRNMYAVAMFLRLRRELGFHLVVETLPGVAPQLGAVVHTRLRLSDGSVHDIGVTLESDLFVPNVESRLTLDEVATRLLRMRDLAARLRQQLSDERNGMFLTWEPARICERHEPDCACELTQLLK